MNFTGLNMNDVRQSNITAVLYLLNREGELSRKDIADKLGLTPAAVTKICRELLYNEKIIETGEFDGNKAGRKKILISVNSDRFFVIGISLEPDFCNYGIYNVSGESLLSGKKEFNREKEPEKLLSEIALEITEMIKISGIDKKDILGAGVGIVGSVDSDGVTKGKYGMWREGIRVKDAFEKALKIPVRVENNVKSFVIAETVFQTQEKGKNQLFIKWGPGVGSAIMINGEVFSSNGNGEAEIGHYIIHPNGADCRCGRKGCLETHVAVNAIINRIKECYSQQTTPVLFELTKGNSRKISYELLLENIDRLDKTVNEIIDRRINRMARAVVNAATLFDPDKVVLFGYMFDERVCRKFIDCCKAYYPKYDESFISVSTLSKKSKYIGPVALALKYMFFEK